MKRKRVATLEPGVYRREAEFADPDDLQAFRVVRTRAGGLVIFALQTPQLTETQSTTYGGGGGFALLRRDFAVRDGRSIVDAADHSRWTLAAPLDASFYFRGDDFGAFAACVRARGVACEGSWAARSAPGVRACFAAVWDGADDLIASMEPLILWRPWRDPSDAARTAGGWLHYDDDEACYDGRTTVQGLAAPRATAPPRAASSSSPTARAATTHPSGATSRWTRATSSAGRRRRSTEASRAATRRPSTTAGCSASRHPSAWSRAPRRRPPRSRSGGACAAGGTTTHRPHRPDLRFAEGLDPPAAPRPLSPDAARLL
ncbi:DNA-directed 5'-3' RNA polymerase [Aureococcus anophagefferens]|nr:DNA-directed 5'-3' RNA polymerase [Aureococcus anophagefferens]